METSRMGAAGGQRKEAAANEMGRGKRERATARLIERWPGTAGSFSVPVSTRRKW